MAVKFAFLAALCIAQAFAFQSEGLEGELAKAIGNEDLRIMTYCLKLQESNIRRINDKMAMVAENIVDGIDNDLKVPVREQLEQFQKPVAAIGMALLETHGTVYTLLNRLNIPKAYEALVAGVHNIEGILVKMRATLNEIKLEHPEMTHAMDWYYRSVVSRMDYMVPYMRREYGLCLVRGRLPIV